MNRLLQRLGAALGLSGQAEGSGGKTTNRAPTITWGALREGWCATTDRPDAWRELFRYTATLGARARPTRTWLRELDAALAPVAEDFEATVAPWLTDRALPGVLIQKQVGAPVPDLRGLVYAAATFGGTRLAQGIGSLAEACFRKVPGVGPRHPKLGNACLAALGQFADGAGVAELTRLQTTVRYASARRQLDTALERAAADAGTTVDHLQEAALPTYGLDASGVWEQAYGDHRARVTVEGRHVHVGWIKPNGRSTKSAPKAAREAFPDAARAVKAHAKAIQGAVEAQAQRLDGRMWDPRGWPFATWKEQWWAHPIRWPITRSVLWVWGEGPDAPTVLLHHGEPQALGGAAVSEPGGDAPVTPWHPLGRPADEIRVWRDWLLELGVQQPLDQVWRTVHPWSEAERSSGRSTAYEGHILHQQGFIAACRRDDWAYTLQGAWDSHNDAVRHYGDVVVALEVAPVSTTGRYDEGYVGFTYVRVGAVRVTVPLGTALDPRLASEILRDVDRLVVSATIARDLRPTEDRWLHYWTSFHEGSLLPSARQRRDALERLLPSLPFEARLEGAYLHVAGTRARYRIHLGTAQIFTDVGAVVLEREAVRQLFPPAEGLPLGDATLHQIVGTAGCLARDATLDDPEFLAQLP